MDKKILLIEDEQFISYIYQLQLNHAGFTTEVASNGNEGLKALQNNKYDLILLDIMLPEVNGLDILKTIKNDDKIKETPVIMLTNLSQEDVMKEAFNNGAAAYWIKANYSPEGMVNEVKKYFENANR